MTMKNNLKTVVLLGLLSGLIIGVGALIGGRSGATFALVIAGVMNLASYWFSDKIALKMSRARPVSRTEAPDLYAIIENLAQQANMPMPSVHIIPSEQPNAFATGRNPQHAAVAVTDGILRILTRDELEGVLAHELGHVRNRDILISSVAATIAAAISWIAFMARWGMFFGGSDDDDNPLGFVGVILAAILAPIVAVIVQFAISRAREYEADRSGAHLSGRPESLASALRKIDAVARQVPMAVNPSAAPMFIVNPLRGRAAADLFMRIFSTHPPTEERVRRLEQLVGRV
jgi:heat shock protein HtpX